MKSSGFLLFSFGNSYIQKSVSHHKCIVQSCCLEPCNYKQKGEIGLN